MLGRGLGTYCLVDVPAPVLASLLRLGDSLVNSEVPVHVSRLLPSSMLVCLEPPAALSARSAKSLVEGCNQLRAKSIPTLVSELSLDNLHLLGNLLL